MTDDPSLYPDPAPPPVESVCWGCGHRFAEDLPDRFCSQRCADKWAAWRASHVPPVGDTVPF